MKKYMVHPGKVRSMNDQDVHYVGAGDLVRLYGVDHKDCVLFDSRKDDPKDPNFIHLRPDRLGRYELAERT